MPDKNGIPLSDFITSASTHDVKAVTEVVDNAVVKRPHSSSEAKHWRYRRLGQHLCLDKAYNPKPVEQEITKREYLLHIPHKRKRGENVEKQDIEPKTIPCEKMDGGENQFMAQQVQETAHKIRKEG